MVVGMKDSLKKIIAEYRRRSDDILIDKLVELIEELIKDNAREQQKN
jgi:hypothetical protein